MSEFDSDLFDSNEVGKGKSRRRKKGGAKAKAEFQFDSSAAPIKLESFFKDVLESEPDQIDFDSSISHNTRDAPMITEVPNYGLNCHTQSGDFLSLANDFLVVLDEKDDLAEPNNFEDSKVNNTLPAVARVESVIKEVNQNIMETKMQYKELTAKRLTLKALQMFSFSDHYKKHFQLDANELRSLNVEMMIDKSPQSLLFLNNLGSKYYEESRQFYKMPERIKPHNILMNWKCRNMSIFAYLLSQISMNDLLAPDKPLNLPTEFRNTYVDPLCLNRIFEYFGLKFFDYNLDLDTALKHNNIISMYYPARKKYLLKDLFRRKRKNIVEEELLFSIEPDGSLMNNGMMDLTV